MPFQSACMPVHIVNRNVVSLFENSFWIIQSCGTIFDYLADLFQNRNLYMTLYICTLYITSFMLKSKISV